MLGRVRNYLMLAAVIIVAAWFVGAHPAMANEDTQLLEADSPTMPESPPPAEMLGERDASIRVNVMPGAGVGRGKPYTWPGRELKVWGNVTNGTPPFTFEWTFGDGSPAVSGGVADARNIEVTHTYATLGQKKAVLTVTDADGDFDVDTVTINVAPFELETEINAAIHDGLHWLYLQQASNGSWNGWTQYGTFTVAATAQAIICFENDGLLPIDDPDKNIYVDCIRKGLDYVTANLQTVNIGPQSWCDPEQVVEGNNDANGLGVYAYCNNRPTYAIGMIMMALVGTQDPTLVANTGPTNIIGRTYYDLVVDMVDYCVWAQNDVNSYYRGGWRYGPNNSSSDNSVSQWPAIGLEAAETQWGISPPPCVKSELIRWVNNSSGSGCYRYTTSTGSLAMTGAGICELAFCDVPYTDSRFQAALNCLCSKWNNSDNKGFYYGMYAIAKGLRIAVNEAGEPDPQALETICGSLNWYDDYARYLVDRQYDGGSWPTPSYWSNLGVFDDQWAILVLEEEWTSCLTSAEINAPDTVAPSTAFMADGWNSGNSCEGIEINQWLWDFDASDGLDWENPDAVGAEVTVPGYPLPENIAEGTFVITLRVRDNADVPYYATASKTIVVDRNNRDGRLLKPVFRGIQTTHLQMFCGDRCTFPD